MYDITFTVFPLQPWQLDTKITTEKISSLDEGWLFIGTFKVRSVLGMINKEMLAKFIYKPINWKIVYLEKLQNLWLYVSWRKKVGKSANIFD